MSDAPHSASIPFFESLCDFMATRRTIRRYTAEDVSDETLNRLLTLASRTQTMGGLQLYSVVTTRDAAMKRRLSPLHFGQPMVTEAPVVLTFCADYHRTTAWCNCRRANPGYDNLLSFLNAATDALLFCQTFCTLAEAEGLGLCYLGTTLYNPLGIIEALRLPRLVMPVATITLGHPAEVPPTLTERLPLTASSTPSTTLPPRPRPSTATMPPKKLWPKTKPSSAKTTKRPSHKSSPTCATPAATAKP